MPNRKEIGETSRDVDSLRDGIEYRYKEAKTKKAFTQRADGRPIGTHRRFPDFRISPVNLAASLSRRPLQPSTTTDNRPELQVSG
jgi:hypothetical protein